MKPKFSWIVVLLFISPALAIEAPVDDAPPPPLLKQGATTPDRAPRPAPFDASPRTSPDQSALPQPEEPKTAFLGLVTAEVPSLLSEHLRLKTGEGIMVRALMPDGPAAKAGISVHDVVLKVGEKSISSPADLSAEISKHQIGETIRLSLIHQGQPVTREVVLGERPPQVAASSPSGGQRRGRYPLQGLPPSQREQLRQLLEERESFGADEMPDPTHGMENALLRMRQRMERLMQGQEIPDDFSSAPSEASSHSHATVRVMDHEGSIELKSTDGDKEITAYDATGNLVWKGPWTTPEDRAAAPKEIRERVSRLRLDTNFQGKSLRFKLNPEPSVQN
ncbi:MAG: PDZ domain-containing protein [Luteolibacter sp.]